MGNYWGYLATVKQPNSRQQTIVVEPMKRLEEEPDTKPDETPKEVNGMVSVTQPKMWTKSTSDQLFMRVQPVILEEEEEKEVGSTEQSVEEPPVLDKVEEPLNTPPHMDEKTTTSSVDGTTKSKKKKHKNKHNK